MTDKKAYKLLKRCQKGLRRCTRILSRIARDNALDAGVQDDANRWWSKMADVAEAMAKELGPRGFYHD